MKDPMENEGDRAPSEYECAWCGDGLDSLSEYLDHAERHLDGDDT